MIGRTLGHHRIIGQLGQGGMGVVYLAEDTRLGRRVALKVLPPEMASDPARQARFEREARAVAALNHPNIVTIHSVEQAEGVHFLTMELVDGRRLTEMLTKDGVPLPRLLEWSVSIAEALGAAHRQGVVHRDLKPDNIMVTSEGRIKVLDFGLAKLREPAAAEAQTAVPTASVTGEGKILGTVSYMSPEQAEGKPLDHRSDIFSFGVLLYEMATGRRPFQGDTPISTISSILKDTPPPPQQINSAIPEHLGRIVRRCLAKEPGRRYQSTDDLRNELRDLKEESESGEVIVERPAPAPAAHRRRGAAAATIAGAALLLALALAAAWLWPGGRTAPSPARPSGAALQMVRATTDGHVVEAAISPDGRYVAYVRRIGSMFSLHLRQLVTGAELEVAPPSEAAVESLAFSGDGDYLHYVAIEPLHRSGWVHRVPVLGGTPRKLVDGAETVGASPDGRSLAIVFIEGQDNILRVTGRDGENPRTLAVRTGRDHFDSPPAWSDDGASIAITSHRLGEPQRIVLFDPAGGAERPLEAASLRSLWQLSWIPGSRSLLVSGSERPANQGAASQIWQVSGSGEAEPLTRDLNSYFYVSITKDGGTMAAVQVERRSGIDVAPVKAGMPGPITELFPISAAQSGIGGLAWLPDNRLLHGSLQGDIGQVSLTDVVTGATRPVTAGERHRDPSVSRNGRTLVLLRNDGAHSLLWRLDPGTGREEKLTDGPFDHAAVLSPDGSWLVYTSMGDPIQVLKRPMGGGAAVTLLQGTAWCGDMSADGRALCVRTLPSGEGQMVLLPLAGGELQPTSVIPPAARAVKFGPDGLTLTWIVNEGGAAELWGESPRKGAPRRLARFEGKEIHDFAWSPDGRWLALTKISESGDVVLLKRPRS